MNRMQSLTTRPELLAVFNKKRIKTLAALNKRQISKLITKLDKLDKVATELAAMGLEEHISLSKKVAALRKVKP